MSIRFLRHKEIINNVLSKFWIFLLIIILSVGHSRMIANAAGEEESKKGSITIVLQEINTPKSGVTMTIFKVGDRIASDGQWSFQLVDALSDLDIDLNSLTFAKDQEKAAKLFRKHKNLKTLEQESDKTDKDGKVVFQDVDQGVYLILATNNGSYGLVETMLISVPHMNENGQEWVYDVTAYPKGEEDTIKEITPIPPVETTPEPPKTIIKEVVTGNGSTYQAPKTGDDAPIMMMIGLIMISSLSIFVLLKKKKNSLNP